MRKIKNNFLFVIGLMLTLGLTSAFGFGGDDKNKRPKNTGILTVKTSPVSYPVKVDGEYKGMTGVGTGAEIFLAPGMHKIEIEFPNGKTYTRDVEIIKDRKNCVCLKYIEETIKRPCPYDVRVDGPDKVLEGDLITFAAINSVTGSTTPINYRWTVSPESARVTSGLGTSAITVDTTGLGGQTIHADLDVTDDVYGKTCFQKNSVPTEVEKKPEIKPFKCDEFESGPFDDTKARFDNCVLQLQGSPDAQLYLIIYQGTDKISMTRNTYDKISKRTLDYLVKTRGVDPRRISIVKWGDRPKTAFEIWLVPPGAQPPVPQ
jgi:PEGA domain